MQLENQLAIAAPKVEFADRVGEASGILIGNFAKVVGIGPNKLFAWMRDHKILIASGSRRNVPMQEYMDRGYFAVKETAVIHPCLAVVSRKHMDGWTPVFNSGQLMFDDIDLLTMLQLVARVVADSLGNFLPTPLTSTTQSLQQG